MINSPITENILDDTNNSNDNLPIDIESNNKINYDKYVLLDEKDKKYMCYLLICMLSMLFILMFFFFSCLFIFKLKSN